MDTTSTRMTRASSKKLEEAAKTSQTPPTGAVGTSSSLQTEDYAAEISEEISEEALEELEDEDDDEVTNSRRAGPSQQSTATATSALRPDDVDTNGKKPKNAKLGQRDDNLLRIPCTHVVTGEKVVRQFPGLALDIGSFNDINWKDPYHIHAINKWRNQIYYRSGFRSRNVSAWHEDEETWIELFYRLLIVESREGNFINMPPHKDICASFNKFFKGKLLEGNDSDFVDREVQSLANKVIRTGKLSKLRSLLDEIFEENKNKRKSTVTASHSLPVITEQLFQRFKAKKEDVGKAEGNSAEKWTSLFRDAKSGTDELTTILLDSKKQDSRTRKAKTRRPEASRTGTEQSEQDARMEAALALIALANSNPLGTSTTKATPLAAERATLNDQRASQPADERPFTRATTASNRNVEEPIDELDPARPDGNKRRKINETQGVMAGKRIQTPKEPLERKKVALSKQNKALPPPAPGPSPIPFGHSPVPLQSNIRSFFAIKHQPHGSASGWTAINHAREEEVLSENEDVIEVSSGESEDDFMDDEMIDAE